MNSLFRNLSIPAMLAVFAAPIYAQTGADLNVSPKRMVFSQTQRTATVFVYNRGTEPATYSIELTDRVMTPDGNIRTLEDLAKDPSAAPYAALLKSAKPMIVYTPRRVTLGPNENQTIRLRALRPAGLADGEYRTFLTITAVPPEDTGFTAEQAGSQRTEELSMSIVALFSLSIPVIVRQGEGEVSVKISDSKIESKSLIVNLLRAGSSSLYGDLEIRRGSANGELVGFVKGLGIYPEVQNRQVTVALTGDIKPGEKLMALFRDDDLKPGSILTSEMLVAR